MPDIFSIEFNREAFTIFNSSRDFEADEALSDEATSDEVTLSHQSTRYSNADSTTDPDVQSALCARGIVSKILSFMKRTTFLGIISLYGKVRYTLEGYEHLFVMMKDSPNGQILLSSSTMRKKIFQSC